MARKRQRRAPESGAVIQNRSGTWRARTYVGDGKHVSLGSFRTKADAERALLLAGADQQRGGWVDPRNGNVTLEAYANRWLAHRHNLRIRTVELYRSQLDNHIIPALGRRELSKLSTAEVRVWFANLVQESRLAATTAAKCYRLLRTILNTAVEDELIVKNPCVIKGAATERSPERPIATIAQVDALATAIDPRWRALVLLATYGSLRWGELTALTRQRIDLHAGTVEVVEQALELSGGTRVLGPPKTDAGRRTITMPAFVVDELADHMRRYVGPEPDAVVFTGPKGAPLRRGNWNGKWNAVRKAVGCDGLRFHDLRHTGNTLAASTGASTKELMARVGHSSARAALHYQHATREARRSDRRRPRCDGKAEGVEGGDAQCHQTAAQPSVHWAHVRPALRRRARALRRQDAAGAVAVGGRRGGPRRRPGRGDPVRLGVPGRGRTRLRHRSARRVRSHRTGGEAADDGAHPIGDRDLRAGRCDRHRSGGDGGAPRRRRLHPVLAGPRGSPGVSARECPSSLIRTSG